LLGACLLTPEAITTALELVEAENFYRPSHGHIFDALASLSRRGDAVDPVTVADHLERSGLLELVGGLPALISLQADTPATSSAGRYARIVAERAVMRRMIAAGGEIVEMGYSLPDDMGAATARALALVQELAGGDGSEPPWPVLDDAGWYGPFGDYALRAAAYTEADPVGILVCSLAIFGALIGASPYMLAGNAHHGVKIFPVLVGRSAKARKGSAFAAAEGPLVMADPDFYKTRVGGGFNSGEALADAFEAPDAGPADVRFLCLEPELGRLLAVSGRDGSIMSMVARNAWDGRRLETRARSKKVVVDDHHLVIIGQTTGEELRAKLSADDLYNGFANRFLWVAVRSGELQPDGGSIPDEVMEDFANVISKAAHKARPRGRMIREAAGEARWAEVYRELRADDPPGALGAAISRGDPQTMRLSMLYALADGAAKITATHVDAAYALWRYCRASAAWIWSAGGDDSVAQRILAALTDRPRGMSGRDLHNEFHRHLPASKLAGALQSLEAQGRITSAKVPTGGRPSNVYTLSERTNKANKDGGPDAT
jgi:DNA-binding PadR family transcriptional regulator